VAAGGGEGEVKPHLSSVCARKWLMAKGRETDFRTSGAVLLPSTIVILNIKLSDHQAAALAAKARARGVTAEEYAREVLARDLAPEWLQSAWEETRHTGADALSISDIDAEIAAARKARWDSRIDPGS
jgi:hypothetical protein